mgnify:CR=1 FL=1
MSIKATELCKNYMVGGQRVAALDGVSLEVGDGEYVTVVGASGSGKTTLMNILGCLDLPTSGSYFLTITGISSAIPTIAAWLSAPFSSVIIPVADFISGSIALDVLGITNISYRYGSAESD